MGSPIQGKENPIWNGAPTILYSIPGILKASLGFVFWLILFAIRYAIIQIGPLHEMFRSIAKETGFSVELLITIPSLLFIVFSIGSLSKVGVILLRHFNKRYTITTQRIIIRTGILNLTSKQIELFRPKGFFCIPDALG